MAVSFGAVNAVLQNMIQQNYLVRRFADPILARFLFRSLADPERWEANIGETKTWTRTGLVAPALTPLTPGNDPTPKRYAMEQWATEAAQYGEAIDTHMPSSRTAIASLFAKDATTCGINAAETLNRLARNRLMAAYLSGHACAMAAAIATATRVHLSSLNGFTTALLNGRPTTVSATNPLAIQFGDGTGEPNNTVVAVVADNPAAPLGPGWITLGAALSVGIAARSAVLATDRPTIIRVGGGLSVDDISAADTLTLQDIINAVATLEGNSVPTFEEGAYRSHLDSTAKSQLFSDQAWREIHMTLAEGYAYRRFVIGEKGGAMHFPNQVMPNMQNTGTPVLSGPTNARVSTEIGGEVRNENNVQIGRVLIAGQGSLTECYIPEEEYTAEGTGLARIGGFAVVNDGVAIMTDRIRYVLRFPTDRLQQIYSHAWSWSGDFGVPSDSVASGTGRFKRAVVIEYARG